MPFQGEWKPYFADKGSLYSNPEFKDKIIRRGSVRMRGENLKEFDLEKTNKLYRLLKESVEIASSSGIRFPDFNVVYGKEQEDWDISAFLVMDKIEGKRLFEISEPSPKLIQEVINYCQSISRYFSDSFDKSSNWFGDLGLHQVMWGHREDIEKDSLYNIDIETLNLRENELDPIDKDKFAEASLFGMRIELRRLLFQISENEKRWGVRLEEARNSVLDTYRHITGGKEPLGDMYFVPLDGMFPEDK